VRSAFTLEFRYSITQDPGATAGDGMAFMLANERIDHTFLGNIGGSLGVAGLKGFGVELDTYNNGQCGDIPDDHVGIMSLESCGAGFPKDLFPPVPVPLKNTSGTCTIVLAGSELTVSLNNRVVTKGVLPGYRPGVPYRFGFGAGTGAAVGRHAVSGVKLSFDSNRCL